MLEICDDNQSCPRARKSNRKEKPTEPKSWPTLDLWAETPSQAATERKADVVEKKTPIPAAATEHSQSSKATKEDKTAVPEPACEERKRPLPAFLPGQSIIQWWASWFKNADEPPKKYNKKKRPRWFSGEVLSYNGYKAIKYAGIQQVAQHCYVTY